MLDGERAIVTGAASGIGAEICRRFAAEGAAVAVLDRDGDRAAAVAAELDGHPFTVDVSDAVATAEAVRSAAAALGGVSILSTNAGASQLSRLHLTTPDQFDTLVRVNLTGTWTAMRATLPLMVDGGGGAIVTNGSGSAVRPTFGELAYSAAKAGVVALTQGAAQEYGPSVRVNCVSAGVIRTPMSEPMWQVPGAIERIDAATPLRRTGTPADVADAVLFLASGQARFITGQNLVVDGGLGLAQPGITDVLEGFTPSQ